MQKLSQNLKKFEIRCEQEVPEYLVPEFIKDQRKLFENKTTKKLEKVLVKSKNQEFEQSLKRRMEGQNLDISDLKKKIKQQGDQYVMVDQSKENEEDTDPSRLKVLSSKKLWKLKHGYKLQKINKRLEKNGIFDYK